MDVYDEKLIGWGIDYLYIWINGLEEKNSFGIIHNISVINPPNILLKVVRENYIKLTLQRQS